jgi:hypothetical protein
MYLRPNESQIGKTALEFAEAARHDLVEQLADSPFALPIQPEHHDPVEAPSAYVGERSTRSVERSES